MKIHELGNIPLQGRRATPFAVAIDGEVRLFPEMSAAHTYALDAESTSDRSVVRFTALLEPEYLNDPVVYGWRQVTYFFRL